VYKKERVLGKCYICLAVQFVLMDPPLTNTFVPTLNLEETKLLRDEITYQSLVAKVKYMESSGPILWIPSFLK